MTSPYVKVPTLPPGNAEPTCRRDEDRTLLSLHTWTSMPMQRGLRTVAQEVAQARWIKLRGDNVRKPSQQGASGRLAGAGESPPVPPDR